MLKILLVVVTLPLIFGPCQAEAATQIERASGGTVVTDLGYGIAVNKGSSLNREYISVKDPSLPATFVGVPGIKTVYKDEGRGGDYQYSAEFSIQVAEPIAAVEVLFVCFDIWGNHTRTLRVSEVMDIAVGQHKMSGQWRVFSENEVSEHYASIAYISRVRTASGRVVEADRLPVVLEGKRMNEKFTDQNAMPSEEKKP